MTGKTVGKVAAGGFAGILLWATVYGVWNYWMDMKRSVKAPRSARSRVPSR